jgi:hypothetical protein
MTKQRRGISASLRRAHVAIDNTMKIPAILTIVSQYGYSLEHMEAGMALYQAANASVGSRTIAAGAQSGARKHMRTTESKAFRAYQKASEIAKAIYRGDRERVIALGLDGPMPRATGSFLTAAFKLFDNAAAAAALTEFGYTEERLGEERAKIVHYQQAANEYQVAMGASQLATQHQNAALDAMIRWTDQYIRVARAVLKDEGQLLEKIGLQVRNRKTAAQRNAPKKAAATRAAKKVAQEPEPV